MSVSTAVRAIRGNLVAEREVKSSLLLRPLALIRRGWERLGMRRFALLCAVTGIICVLPSLAIGFAQDDYFLLLVFEPHPLAADLHMDIMDNFAFSDGEPDTNAIRFEMGVLPWWSVPDWQVSFWRPLSSLMHWVEYKIFGHNPLPMHVISVLVYGVLCFTAAALYRRIHLGLWSAGLAAMLFAVDPVHGIPAGWISDRNALLSALFGILALVLHARWRTSEKDHWRWGVAAVGSLTIGLFCGEAAVSAGAYLFAYQAFIDPATRLGGTVGENSRKLLAGIAVLLPYLAAVIVWRVIYHQMDYGVHGSWMYVDPLSNPSLFVQNVFWYTPIFLLGAFALPDGVAWNFVPTTWALAWSALAWIFFTGMLRVMWPLLSKSSAARFWLAGSFLSAIPCCATIPGDRIITYPALGALGLISLFLADRAEQGRLLPRRTLASAFAGLFVFCHLFASPFALLAASKSIQDMHDFFSQSSHSLPVEAEIESKNYIALRTPLDMLGASLPLFRIGEGQPLPAQWRYLYSGISAMEIERPDAHTLVLRPATGFLPDGLGQIFRDTRSFPMQAGYTHSVKGMKAEVLAVSEEGRPTEVRFTFESDLDDPSMHFVQWEKGCYVPVTLPPPGGRMSMPATKVSDILRVALRLDAPPEKATGNGLGARP